VILYASLEPFNHPDNMLKVIEAVFDCQRSRIFGRGERAEGMSLTEMNQRSGLPDSGGIDVATNQRVNQGGLADAWYAFDEQRIEWRYRVFSHDTKPQMLMM
jgi:hypothetical protein